MESDASTPKFRKEKHVQGRNRKRLEKDKVLIGLDGEEI